MVHILKSIRDEINRTLADASIEVDISGAVKDVLILVDPPRNSEVDEEDLPALFVFIEGENVSPETLGGHHTRTIRVLIYIFAKSKSSPLDQLDEMQLKIEMALAANNTIGGLCRQFRLAAMAAHSDQGRVNFGSRSLEFICVTTVTSHNPTV